MILVVEDNCDVREMVGLVLEDGGYRVTTAANGREGLARLGPGTADLVLLDLTMPVMNGYQFLSDKAADPRLRKVPVVVMTAVRDCALLLVIPLVLEILWKPFTAQALLEVVHRSAQLATS
jgi:CheY-like chemotaxis protein